VPSDGVSPVISPIYSKLLPAGINVAMVEDVFGEVLKCVPASERVKRVAVW